MIVLPGVYDGVSGLPSSYVIERFAVVLNIKRAERCDSYKICYIWSVFYQLWPGPDFSIKEVEQYYASLLFAYIP